MKTFFLILLTFVCFSVNVMAQEKSLLQYFEKPVRNVYNQIAIAQKYENGDGVEKDSAKAVFWYKKAIDNRGDIANVHLAALYERYNNKAEAYKYFMRYYIDVYNAKTGKGKVNMMSESLYTLCQYKIGEYKAFGFDGIPKDLNGSIPYLKYAALNNYGDAAYLNLSNVYLELGDSLGAFNAAERCFAQYKTTRSVLKLAGYYLNGTGCNVDYDKAYELLVPLADKGNALVLLTLGDLHCKSNFHLFNYKLAFSRYSQVLETCDSLMISDTKNVEYYTSIKATALRKLSNFYRFGRGVEKDINKAEEILNEAAKYGNTDAKSLLEL